MTAGRSGNLAARIMLRAASRLVPRGRRAEWLERWQAELQVLLADDAALVSPLGLTRGAWRDALVERGHAWRDAWALTGIAADLRLAMRRVRRAPVASALIAGITGLGAAAATGLFTLVDAAILRTPPGITGPDGLLQVGRGDAADFDNFSFPNYQDLRAGTEGAVSLAAFGTGSIVIGRGAAATLAPVQYVSANYFAVTGVRVDAGPGLSRNADRSSEAILSTPFAASHPDVLVARVVVVNGRPVPVVGVAGAGFVGTSTGVAPPALWLSFAAADTPERRLHERGWSWLWIVGRRQEGVTFAAASALLHTVHGQLTREHRTTIADRVTVVPHVGLRPPDRQEAVRISSLLMAGAMLLWIVAAATCAGLHFARTLSESRGMAVQMAIGASRARILRGLLFEHVMLAAAGAVSAWILATWVTVAIHAALPYDLAVELRPDARTLGFALAVSVLVALLVGLMPLRSATSPDLVHGLREGGRAGRRNRAGGVLVSVQVALATALLMSAGLLARSLDEAGSAATGFDASDVLVASIRRQPAGPDPSRIREAIRNRLAVLPGVTAVGFSTSLPLAGPHSSRAVFAAGSEYSPDARPVTLGTAWVDRGFFDVLRLRPAEGRLPGPADGRDGTTPVVMSSAAVAQLWPDGGALRKAESGPLTISVTGVLPEIRMRSIRETGQRIMFLPIDGSPQAMGFVLVRRTGPSAPAVGTVRDALIELNADVLCGPVETLQSAMGRGLGDTRVAAQLALPLAALATLLAGAGLYGVSARQALDRRREFAVRIALGATTAALSRQVLVDSIRRALPGLMLGLVMAAGLAIGLRALLFGVGLVDPMVVAVTVGLVAGCAIAAAALPARRAARVQPHAALHGD